MDGVDFHDIDWMGRKFTDFYPARSPEKGPGWYVFGRNPAYNDSLIHLCARPDVEPRKHRLYNGLVRRGWSTKREAQAVADQLNSKERA